MADVSPEAIGVLDGSSLILGLPLCASLLRFLGAGREHRARTPPLAYLRERFWRIKRTRHQMRYARTKVAFWA